MHVKNLEILNQDLETVLKNKPDMKIFEGVGNEKIMEEMLEETIPKTNVEVKKEPILQKAHNNIYNFEDRPEEKKTELLAPPSKFSNTPKNLSQEPVFPKNSPKEFVPKKEKPVKLKTINEERKGRISFKGKGIGKEKKSKNFGTKNNQNGVNSRLIQVNIYLFINILNYRSQSN